MKNLFFTLIIFFFSLNVFGEVKICQFPKDSIKSEITLFSLANSFKATQLNLNNSLLENPKLNIFISNQNKSTLKEDKDFVLFISLIILKQYELHITKYHQGFDLFTMRAGNAGFIVNSFFELTNLPKETKGINSSYILDFISSNESLKSDSSITDIINRIGKLSK